ncbi:hypothetical protein [Glycomyces sp. NPDC021274]|uniref:hypothetical protein n=1 Tax=Glycomyces sp. NPDC021274 TaxID=3155120 RepID=UPI0033C08AD8
MWHWSSDALVALPEITTFPALGLVAYLSALGPTIPYAVGTVPLTTSGAAIVAVLA